MLLSLTFKVQSFAIASANSHCSQELDTTLTESDYTEEAHKTSVKNQLETPDCHNEPSHHCECPFHTLHCHHFSWPYTSDTNEFPLMISLEKYFSSPIALAKPAPVLDGPFQPPRS